jgi:hypothetical protein
MINVIANLDQIAFAIFSVIIMAQSFRALNCCTKDTKLSMRIPLVLFMAASTGVLILLVSGIIIHWTLGALLVGVAFYLVSDRRNQIVSFNETPQHK